MPDQPPAKQRPYGGPGGHRPVRQAAPAAYAELRCKTNFSFLEGASHPDELVNRATELGYQALAVTDRNTLAGVVRAHTAARQTGLKLLIGPRLLHSMLHRSCCWPRIAKATPSFAGS